MIALLDELLDIALRHPPKEYRGMEGTLYDAIKFLSKFYLQFLGQLVQLPTFRTLWSQVLSRMEMYMKAKLRGRGSEKIQELIPELLRNMLQVMHASGILVKTSTVTSDSLWELTWQHVYNISPSLQPNMFSEQTSIVKGNEQLPVDGNQILHGLVVAGVESGSNPLATGSSSSVGTGDTRHEEKQLLERQ